MKGSVTKDESNGHHFSESTQSAFRRISVKKEHKSDDKNDLPFILGNNNSTSTNGNGNSKIFTSTTSTITTHTPPLLNPFDLLSSSWYKTAAAAAAVFPYHSTAPFLRPELLFPPPPSPFLAAAIGQFSRFMNDGAMSRYPFPSQMPLQPPPLVSSTSPPSPQKRTSRPPPSSVSSPPKKMLTKQESPIPSDQQQQLHYHQYAITNNNLFLPTTPNSMSSAFMGLIRNDGKPKNVKKYKCDECQRAFSRSNTLVTHKRIHTGEKPFKCEICMRAFRQPGNLTRHKLTHTAAKPYSCVTCNKAFNRASNLHAHMRTHSQTGACFICTICQQEFQHKYELKIHSTIHIGSKMYSCQHCGKNFKYYSQLTNHLRIHTSPLNLTSAVMSTTKSTANNSNHDEETLDNDQRSSAESASENEDNN
ncbi:unnamed protein product [Didymodactylos carnosus]|uniref:C2H2-type domain-containing protein n=1 Tax=Didymodactylos carnosus TaxID=1234261 RepID=A0A814L501_9BILA|nr:unnamed protein product [Didymodactylos carnosus]CAF1060115.1 unnamed protein product [Didymodactylos carnosus]CAF3604922.1 unnamed protein product [Didymodactylos carnosus]CAF3828586.1 unnamed protein product [Didymodactylos carnosus]